MPKRIKVVAASDIHVPNHDKKAFNWFIQGVRDEKPDEIVLVGDLFEAEAASRWAKEGANKLSKEYAQANELLAEIRDAAPDAKRTFVFGNHDDNILAPHRIPEEIRDLCDFRLHIAELKHWNMPTKYGYDRTQSVYRVGQVTFAHLVKTSDRGLLEQAILLNDPYGLMVGAHSHQPKPVTQVYFKSKTPLPYWFCNLGCLCGLGPGYMERHNKFEWGHGYGVFEINPSAGRHKSLRRTPDWDGDVRILQMFDNSLYHPRKFAV